MALIKSISGIRGTIGGRPGESLTPVDIVKYTKAFARQRSLKTNKKELKIVIGRDARVSGEMVSRIVSGTLMSMGANVVDGGLSTTPTIEMAVSELNADGGIIITASHNPTEWNALKLLDENGEFLSDKDGKEILELADALSTEFALWSDLGKIEKADGLIEMHINHILKHQLVDVELIRSADFTVVIDCVNSTGGLAIPPLLSALGVNKIIELNTAPTGIFPHNPEPLPENLVDICSAVKKERADLGFVVDPDVDRLAVVTEQGEVFGEEYTLVAVADYVLTHRKGPAVSNLSSSRALSDICSRHGVNYHASAVGEVNVVEEMKRTGAVIGGEGNGGVILPDLHYGRDALAGIALFLSLLASRKVPCSGLRSGYPDYFMVKDKIPLTPEVDIDDILVKIAQAFSNEQVTTIDGVKIDFEEGWVHLRKSNTEPIIRIYSEAGDPAKAKKLVEDVRGEISNT